MSWLLKALRPQLSSLQVSHTQWDTHTSYHRHEAVPSTCYDAVQSKSSVVNIKYQRTGSLEEKESWKIMEQLSPVSGIRETPAGLLTFSELLLVFVACPSNRKKIQWEIVAATACVCACALSFRRIEIFNRVWCLFELCVRCAAPVSYSCERRRLWKPIFKWLIIIRCLLKHNAYLLIQNGESSASITNSTPISMICSH